MCKESKVKILTTKEGVGGSQGSGYERSDTIRKRKQKAEWKYVQS